MVKQSIRIPLGREAWLQGELTTAAHGIVIFAHGSGSSRLSPRNQFVASELNTAGHGTLLFDLLTEAEERIDQQTRHLRFDIPLLTNRLVTATRWVLEQYPVPLGYFGASTGAAAALAASVRMGAAVQAVVSRGGRPDLASTLLGQVSAATLLLVGEQDWEVIELNEFALDRIGSTVKKLSIIPNATHLFEEPGAIEEVSRQAAEWFTRYLQ